MAPWQVGLINLKTGDAGCDGACEEMFGLMQSRGVECVYDDRDERAGAKFADMDLIGLPWQLVVGPRGLKDGNVEIKSRAGGERREMSLDAAHAWIADYSAEG